MTTRFYFHLKNDTGAQRDEQGETFDTDEAAIRHAGRSVGDILGDDLATGRKAASIELTVAHGDGSTVATITGSVRIDPAD